MFFYEGYGGMSESVRVVAFAGSIEVAFSRFPHMSFI